MFRWRVVQRRQNVKIVVLVSQQILFYYISYIFSNEAHWHINIKEFKLRIMQQSFVNYKDPYTSEMIKNYTLCCQLLALFKILFSSYWQLTYWIEQKFSLSLLLPTSHTTKMYCLFVDSLSLALYKNLLSICWQLEPRTIQEFVISLLTAGPSHCTKMHCLFVTDDLSHCTKIYYLIVDFWFIPLQKMYYLFVDRVSRTLQNALYLCWQLIIYYLFVDFWLLPLFKIFDDLFVDSWFLALYTYLLSFCWYCKTCVLCVYNFHRTLFKKISFLYVYC